MRRQSKNRTGTSAAIIGLLIFSLLSQPLLALGEQAKETESSVEAQLFRVIEEVVLADEVTLLPGTYIYGVTSDTDNQVSVQYQEAEVQLAGTLVEEADLSLDKPFPDFTELPAEKVQKTLNAEAKLYSLPDAEAGAVMLKSANLPIYQDDQQREAALIGNVYFYLDTADFETVLISTEKAAVEQTEAEPVQTEEETSPVSDSVEAEATPEADGQESDNPAKAEEDVSSAIDEINPSNSPTAAGEVTTDIASAAGKADQQVDPWEGVSSDYFKVTGENAVVYDNRGKGLTKIGELEKGEIYPRVSDYGNWHRIQYGSIYGYIRKSNTIPDDGSSLTNENKSYQNQQIAFTVPEDVTIYDNTKPEGLTPFGTLEKGTSYPVADDYGNWWRVIFSGKVGYVLKKEVQVTAQTTFTENDRYFEVVESNTAVYDNRGKGLVKVGELEKGQVYPRVSDYGNWHRIQFGDHYGYVQKSDTVVAQGNQIKNENTNFQQSSNKFRATETLTVYDNTSGSLVPYGTITQGQTYAIVSDYGNWYRVLYSGRIGYILKQQVKGVFTDRTSYFEVREPAAVYDNRGEGLRKVGQLEEGQVYPRVSDYGNWHRIQFGDHYGYVQKSKTLPAFGSAIQNKNTGYQNRQSKFRTEETVTIYDNTSGSLVPFGTIVKGEAYALVSDYGNWYRILYSGRVGFVSKEHLAGVFAESTKYFEAVSDIPIYDNRGDGLKKVGELKAGQSYYRLSDYGDWHRIRYGDYYGYVRKRDTLPIDSRPYKNSIRYRTPIGNLTADKATIVYDNTGSGLVPFGEITAGTTHPIVNDYGDWVEINLAGRYGFVHKNDVTEKIVTIESIVNPNQEYTYEEMQADITQLAKAYPDLISWKVIGKSVDDRNIYAVKLGKGSTEISINASHHAREWLTTNVVMEMIDEYSQAYVKGSSMDGYHARKILDNASIWFVPMVNPDGVTLVQKGAFSAKNPSKVIAINGGSSNFDAWKANIRGVDLNRQYPANWAYVRANPGYPTPKNYKGPYPLSEPESRTMYDFTLAHDFKTVVAYHSSGEVLYWNSRLKDGTPLKIASRRLADRISAKTGYSLYFSTGAPSGGTYTDWIMMSEKQPAFTPEISPYVGERPVPVSSFSSIWNKNNSIGLMLAEEAYQNRNNR